MNSEDMRLALAARDEGLVLTAVSHTTVTVGTASAQAVAANASRAYLLLVNDGDEAIYVSLGGAAALNAGIRLNASGGSYETSTWRGAVQAICTSGNKKLLVTEGA